MLNYPEKVVRKIIRNITTYITVNSIVFLRRRKLHRKKILKSSNSESNLFVRTEVIYVDAVL
jgi:hypothetical protein